METLARAAALLFWIHELQLPNRSKQKHISNPMFLALEDIAFYFGPRYFVGDDIWWAVQSRDLLACVRRPGQCCQCCHQAFLLLAIFFPHSPHGALCLFWQCSRCWRFAQKWFTILRPHIRHGHFLLPVSSYALCFAIKFSSTNTSSISSGSLGEERLISCLCLRRTAVMTPFFVSCLAGIALGVMLTRFILGLNATKAFLWLPRRWSRRCL